MAKLLDNVAIIFIIFIVFLIIVPISSVVLDILILLNLVLSLGIMVIAMYIKESLEFSAFPSLLLIMTLFRIGVNVSSTRLILSNAGEAGKVIKTFGEFVIGGSPIVGFIIFLIIVIVQFLVITKGSERVAEVSARFTLDAMPGKQMSIDADLSSGLIDDATARQRRNKVERGADFYGAMDGASKFVKGDAIVSIIIVFINIIGGSIIGMVSHGFTFSQVLSIYTVATVGEGLVAQIPALLVSTATGIIVTRAATEDSLSTDLTKQLFSYPKTLMITGGVLLLMCFIPGLPILVLLIFGGVLIFAGKSIKDRRAKSSVKEEIDVPLTETQFYKDPERIYDLLGVEQIEVEFGYSLIPLVDEKRGGSFIDRMVMLRRQFALDMGFVIPSVRLRDDSSLNHNEYVIKIKGEAVAQGQILVDHFLVIGLEELDQEIEGIDTIEPAFGIKSKWVDKENSEKAQIYGYTVIDPLSVIITHMSEVIKKHANEMLGRKEVNRILENIKKTDKYIVDDVIPSVIGVGDLQKILGNLLLEQIPIRDMNTILETIGEFAPTVKDPELLTEYIRQSLKRTITRKFADDGTLKVLTINADIENNIMNSVKKNERGSYLAIDPEIVKKIVKSHVEESATVSGMSKMPIVLTSPVVRLYYKKLIEQFVQDSVVLSFNEIEPNIKIQSVGMIAI